ncbi:MAG: hypothetical protein QGI21_06185 [Candidatus Poseidoniaceae archaeon]|jgi:formylmethanofuran dehydrogenase subunit C|nr:hypothetical protein [Candidatus Poseidoniaceae archaeon]
MASVEDVVASSVNINSRLPAQLEKAIERNIVLRIGWTTSGSPVPKEGELGLCPALPDGARIRSLGQLGPFTAAFGRGGTYTHQGSCEGFLGAGNDGSTITCERDAGDYVGYAMRSGRITVLDGVGSDAGSIMSGGILIVRGDSGARIGGGMSGGDIVVHGDVGPDPGAGMSGGRIIINGRCPQPPPGVTLRALSKKEADAINKQMNEEDLMIPSDAVCLESNSTPIEGIMSTCREDFSGISLVTTKKEHNPTYSTCDTVKLIGTDNALALPIPLLPYIPDGASKEIEHPCMVHKSPRDCDIVLIDSKNFVDLPELITNSAGFALDLSSLPHLGGADMDGLLVAAKSIGSESIKILLIDSLSASEHLHTRSTQHGLDCAISLLNDGSGTSAAASLPIVGRSASNNLEDCSAAMILPWSATSEDIVVLCASNIDFVITPAPDEDIEGWLAQTTAGLMAHLNRLGLNSIDALSRANLRACDQDTAAVSGLRLAGYDRPMPHWFAR